MKSTQIEQVRRFNRVVTQRIGVLQDSYLTRGRPLGEARLIFEIGSSGGIDLRILRQRLGLDSGYMSRLLRSLESQDIVKVGKKPGDGRAREVLLTTKGREEFKAYDTLSDRLAESFLTPLDAAERDRLTAAMTEVERLLRYAAIEIAPEPPESSDAKWCLGQYYAELARRFEAGFNPDNGNVLGAAEMTPPAGYLLLARLNGEPVGCGALKRLGRDIGEIKRVWTAPGVRGMGVASRLMDKLEALGRENGFDILRLDTNRALTEAHALYRKRGYRETGRYNDNPYAHYWFEKLLVPKPPCDGQDDGGPDEAAPPAVPSIAPRV